MRIARTLLTVFFTLILSKSLTGAPRDLVILLDSLPDNIDPVSMFDKNAHLIVKQVCERLIYFSTRGEYKGELARSWRFSQGGKALQIEIIHGKTFSDGSVLQSKDVVNMIEKVVKKGFISGFRNIKGATEFASGRKTAISGISLLAPDTIKLEFDKEYYEILNDFSDVQTSVCKLINGILIGTGEFQLKTILKGQSRSLFLEKVREDKSDSDLGRIEFVTTPSNHRIDISFSTKNHPSYLDMRMPYFDPKTIFLGFNLATTAGRDKAAREAIAAAVYSQINQPGQLSRPSFIPRSLVGHSGSVRREPNQVKTSKFPREDLQIYTYSNELLKSAIFVCESLLKNGFQFNCQPKLTSFDEFKHISASGKMSVFIARLSPSKPSPIDLITVFERSSFFNYYFIGPVSELETKINTMSRLLYRNLANREKSAALLEEINRSVIDEYLVVPISDGSEQSIAFDKKIKVPQIGMLGIVDYDLSRVTW